VKLNRNKWVALARFDYRTMTRGVPISLASPQVRIRPVDKGWRAAKTGAVAERAARIPALPGARQVARAGASLRQPGGRGANPPPGLNNPAGSGRGRSVRPGGSPTTDGRGPRDPTLAHEALRDALGVTMRCSSDHPGDP
jgi:hypothetical protein